MNDIDLKGARLINYTQHDLKVLPKQVSDSLL